MTTLRNNSGELKELKAFKVFENHLKFFYILKIPETAASPEVVNTNLQ
jgi:hypothetical protein